MIADALTDLLNQDINDVSAWLVLGLLACVNIPIAFLFFAIGKRVIKDA